MPPIGLITKAAIALLVAVAVWLVAAKIYQAGGDARELPYIKAVSQRNLAVAKRIEALQQAARDAERAGSQRAADISAKADKERANDKAKHDRFVDDLMAGRIRLFVNPTVAGGGGGSAASSGATVAGEVAAGSCELPRMVVLNLERLATTANEVAISLNECRAQLRADRGMP